MGTQLLQSIFNAHRRNPENDIALKVVSLFEAFPEVASFSVEEADGSSPDAPRALALSDISFWPGTTRETQAKTPIALRAALAGFVAERPAMFDLLNGRSFTRTLHQLPDTRHLRAMERV
jgi:hypothetical protein